jgi:hypothetical protein
MPVRERGKFYAFEFWLDGRYYSGTFNGKKGLPVCENKNDARYQLAIVRQKIREGERPDGKREELKDFATFVDRVYLPFAKAHHASYRHAEFRCEMLKKHFVGKRFDEITPMAVVRFIDRRLESKTVRKEVLRNGKKVNKDRSPTTVNKEVTLLSSIFHMAIGEGVTTKTRASIYRSLRGPESPRGGSGTGGFRRTRSEGCSTSVYRAGAGISTTLRRSHC